MRLNHNKIICIKLVHLLYLYINTYKVYSLTPHSIQHLLLKDIFHHISQLHDSVHFYEIIFRLNF